MQLSDIFPGTELKAKFSNHVVITHRGRAKLDEISKLKPACMVEMGGGAWDRYVQATPGCNPQALAPYFDREDPKLYLGMERHIGLKVLHDISYTTADIEDESLTEKRAGELLLAVIYPGVLRISDVTFADVYNEIPEQNRQFQFQYYKGLGLFSELINRCQMFCQKNGLAQITLAAAHIDLLPLFRQYGFEVEDTPAGRMYLEAEHGIPMVKDIARSA